MYTADAMIVLLFFIAITITGQTRLRNMLVAVVIWGFGEIIVFLQLGLYLRNKRDGYEIAWREIKESPAQLAAIHGRYETIPSTIVIP